ncbi:type IV pilus modification protein PilV [Candidatus Symbiobacter mobilis]|uniref:Type IV pilus modification protein PilV n=1 Tax=Candidatus Symbiobacter mobilis CR TaxID=946483 RepID=U5N793_9BURK|nr:type IV pilus modification protein PilV [Candidatus Symbiobacter mobilis]AGX87175.1 type IV pilus modification protein PilV [Candidatus Symbiobacter mobilis CR]
MSTLPFPLPHCLRQSGASLIEVLVTVLVLSFGLLSLGSMLAVSVQLPKIAGLRATASVLASGHIERMRANIPAFIAGNYNEELTYNGMRKGLSKPSSDCVYPNCTPALLATLDRNYTNWKLDSELPAGGMRVERDTSAGVTDGNLWIIWNEPQTFAAINPSSSDQCPSQVASFEDPKPRCLYVRFRL